MGSPDKQRIFSFFENLPIQIKAFAASAVLLICLISLGAIAYVTLDKSEKDFHFLSSSVVPKQRAFASVNDNVVAIHTKIFRYVSWASNGINKNLLGALSAEINSDLGLTDFDFKNLSERPDLTEKEKSDLKDLISRWRQYESSAHDTLDIGSTDAAMATMMLGQSDDKFAAVAEGIKAMTNSAALTTDQISRDLYTDAARKKVILAIGATIALLLSVIATFLVSRSIVRPVKSVTDAMRRLSSGDTDVEVGYGDRRDEIGQMVEAISVFRKNAIEKRAMEIENLETEKRNLKEIAEARARLTDAIETISEGFSLYDADDKLIIFNSRYKNICRLRRHHKAGHELRNNLPHRRRTRKDQGCRRRSGGLDCGTNAPTTGLPAARTSSTAATAAGFRSMSEKPLAAVSSRSMPTSPN